MNFFCENDISPKEIETVIKNTLKEKCGLPKIAISSHVDDFSMKLGDGVPGRGFQIGSVYKLNNRYNTLGIITGINKIKLGRFNNSTRTCITMYLHDPDGNFVFHLPDGQELRCSKRNMTTCLYRNKKLFLLDFSTFIDTTYVGRVEENELVQFISELYN